MKRVTIEDVAREANISPATVSRALRNNGYVSMENRNVIHAAVKKLGYVPNKVARGLRNQKTNLLGHVMGLNSENPLNSRMADAMHEIFEKAGYHVITAMIKDSGGYGRTVIEDLLGQMVEAIIFNAIVKCDNEVINKVISQGVPVVMIERSLDIDGIGVISLDSIEGAGIATRHLIENGHKKISYIGVSPEFDIVEVHRYAGYRQTMAAAGLAIPEHLVYLTPDYSIEFGFEAMQSIYEKGDLPTAIFATSDLLASGALQCLYQHRIRVPEDISIVGYDNTLSHSCAPPLSSIEMHPDQIGLATLKMIQERSEKPYGAASHINILPTLIDRGSVRLL